MHFLFRHFYVLFQLDNGAGNLAQTLVLHTDHGYIMYLIIGADIIFDLYRINVFAAADDHVFLSVYQIDKAILVLFCHIPGKQPSVFQCLFAGFFIVVIAGHDTRSFNCDLAHFSLRYFLMIFIHQAHFPAISRLSDGADLVDVFHAEMDTARPDGLRQTVVGIVSMVRKNGLPVMDHTLRHRLCSDMHQPPLVQFIILQMYPSAFDGFQNILCPRN